MTEQGMVVADWPAPANVHTLVTTRKGGISEAPYASFNVANHVGDTPLAVAGNRDLLREELPSRLSCQWLDQVHSAQVAVIEGAGSVITADGLVTREPDIGCCVLTADCLSVLFTYKEGTEIAVAHGGWRGLLGGILKNTIVALESPSDDLVVWLGPAIGPCHYEVGNKIKQEFLISCSSDDEREIINQSFLASEEEGKLRFDLRKLARQQLQLLGVNEIYGEESCTYCDESNFYSYRRDGVTGRMASIIYFTEAS